MWSTNMLFCTVLLLFTTIKGQEIIVELPEGKIAGHTLTSFRGNPFYAFQEIPYAAPPVGDLRFALPQNVKPWDGILNTTQNTKQCYQEILLFYDPNAAESEDCLYLNIYTPQKPGGTELLPVYVWIHGGAYLAGSGTFDMANPARLIDYGIVVVAINYRLSVFGFLTTEDGVIPGNIGLKDQRFAFRWVKSHIEKFGGDPNKITIGGESAGASSVGFHLVGQNSKDLFRGAILQSGSSIMQLLYTADAKSVAFQLGNALDSTFNSTDSNDLLTLLKSSSAEDIINASSTFSSSYNTNGYVPSWKWMPVIENENEEDILVAAPMHEDFMTGNFHQVPILAGINSEESLTFVSSAQGTDIADEYDKDPSLLIDDRLNIPYESRTDLGTKVKNLYTNSTFAKDQAALVKFTSDVIGVSVIRVAELTSKLVPVYLYQFSFMGPFGLLFLGGARTYVPGAVGVQHGEDVSYFWDWGYPNTASGDDLLVLERLLIFWTDFIKDQNPTPNPDQLLDNVTWPTVNGSNILYLNINLTLEVQSNPRNYDALSSLLFPYLQPPYAVV